jgi:hypothetical protein
MTAGYMRLGGPAHFAEKRAATDILRVLQQSREMDSVMP